MNLFARYGNTVETTKNGAIQNQAHEHGLSAGLERKDKARFELHMRYARGIWAFALRRLEDSDQAGTVVSDTLLEIWRQSLPLPRRVELLYLASREIRVLTLLRARGLKHDELDEALPDQGWEASRLSQQEAQPELSYDAARPSNGRRITNLH